MPTSRQYRFLRIRRSALLCAAALALSIALAAGVAPAARADQWALLIGIDQYKDSSRINQLGSAAADARAIKKALIESEGVPEANIRLLVSDADPNAADTEAKPDRNTILRSLANLAKNVQSGDTVFIFFSGHGIEKNGTSYLLPYDTDAFDSDTITDTAIDTAKFRERLQSVPAGLLILAFDMCRNNPLRGSRGGIGDSNTLKPAQVRGLDFASVSAATGSTPVLAGGPRGVITLFSCSLDERSYEWISKGRGYFSWFLEQGLRGAKDATGSDGAVHVDTLTHYLAANVTDTVKRQEGKTQTPFVEMKGQIEAGKIALTHAANPQTATGASLAPPASAALLATDTHAYIKVALTPAEATVSIDGEPQPIIAGRVALDLKGSSTKSVEIGVEAKGYQARVERMTLTRGTIVPITFALAPVAGAPAPANTATKNISVDSKRATSPEIAISVVMDTSQIGARSPNATAFAAAVPERIQETYATIVEVLGVTPDETPSQVRVIMNPNYPGVAESADGVMTISTGWVSAHPNDLGLVVHEMTHVVQNYDRKRVPEWLTEGMADYIRWYIFEPASKRARPNPATAKYSDSYQTTASFLDFIVSHYDVNLIKKLDRACKQGVFRPRIFTQLTGKTVDALNAEWLASLKP